jgi:hypothetical protein
MSRIATPTEKNLPQVLSPERAREVGLTHSTSAGKTFVPGPFPRARIPTE